MTKADARREARAHWAVFLKSAGPARALANLAAYARAFERRTAFFPLPGELDVIPALGWPLYLPCVRGDLLEFRLALSRDELVPGAFGTREPPADNAIFQLPFTQTDLLVVPAFAVNKGRLRLGKGGGYYDRMARAFAGTKTVCVLPDTLAELDFPGEAHDLKIDIVITESGVR